MSYEITSWAWSQTGLPAHAKYTLLALADYADTAKAECWPSIPALAEKMGHSRTSTKSVRAGIKVLEDRGLVTVVSRKRAGTDAQTSHLYRINWKGSGQNTPTLGANRPGGGGETPYEPVNEPISEPIISYTTDPGGSVLSEGCTTDPDGSALSETESFTPAERADPISPSFHNSKDRTFLLRGVQAIARARADGDEEKLAAHLTKFEGALEEFFSDPDGGIWGEDYGWTDIPHKATDPYEAGKWLNTYLHAWKADVGSLDWKPYAWADET